MPQYDVDTNQPYCGTMSEHEKPSHHDQGGSGLALEEAQPKVKKPPLYKVIILNDDYTPMEFVVQVLKRFFGMSQDKATSVMLHVHTRGRGVAGVYTYEIAETKVVMVNDFAREHEHPLQCTLEQAGED